MSPNNKLRLKVIHTADEYCLFENSKKVLCCLSGGTDSCVLLHVLDSVKNRYGFLLCAVHVNHGIRGEEAKRDEDFCREYCEKLGIELTVCHVDVPAYADEHKLSTELAARQLRYECFERVMKENNCDVAATAHNANDNAETLLFNIIRGTSLKGICGIPYKRDAFVRPLLDASRSEIEEYAKRFKISSVLDSTNISDEYTRNFIRHNIVPLCEQINPDFVGSVTRLTKCAKRDELPQNSKSSEAVAFLRENNISGVNNETVLKLANAMCGGGTKYFDLPNGVTVSVVNGVPCVCNSESKPCVYNNEPLKIGKNIFFEGEVKVECTPLSESFTEFYKSLTTEVYVSANIFDGCFVRNRKTGDSVTVSGIRKLVKKHLIGKKIPVAVRDKLPVVCKGNRVVFVPYIGIDDAFLPSVGDKAVKISVAIDW